MDQLDIVTPINDGLTELTSDIVSAYVTKNPVSLAEMPRLIADVHTALKTLGVAVEQEPVEELKPAVSIRKSVTPDYIVCLDDGKKFKSLKRHLSTLGMTPAEYRTKWGLPADYPMAAPNYSAVRSGLAKSNGLGRKAAPVPVKRGRKSAMAE